MSNLHNVLKKVQQGLTPKPKPVEAPPIEKTKNNTGYIYEESPTIEAAPIVLPKTGGTQGSAKKNILKSFLALICAAAIIAVSGWYIFQQVTNNIPVAQGFAQKSFGPLLLKNVFSYFNIKKPVELKPLAKITIPATTPPINNSPANTTQSTGNSQSGEGPQINQPTTGQTVTLNVHGIMSKSSGNVALINDGVYQEGDEIDGAKIIKIDLDSIQVDINGTIKTIAVNN